MFLGYKFIRPCRAEEPLGRATGGGRDIRVNWPGGFEQLANPRFRAYIRGMTQYQTLADGETVLRDGTIKLHGPAAFEGMRRAGKLAAEILDALVPIVQPGVTTGRIDEVVRQMTLDGGAVPATLGYRGYQHSSCVSINHVVCHGIPSEQKTLKEGDIVNIDVTPLLDGWHGDSSRMYLVGDVPLKARRLVDVTHECLMLGIAQARPGARLGDIGAAIQKHAEASRYGVVREFCGHGLGRLFHDAPEVVHAARAGTGPELKPGMFFTIEPMINLGKSPVKLLDDGWTAVTRDRSLSAQFEHSIGITEDGCEIFTLSPQGLHKPPY
jgi:methionyl aminopeptidase